MKRSDNSRPGPSLVRNRGGGPGKHPNYHDAREESPPPPPDSDDASGSGSDLER